MKLQRPPGPPNYFWDPALYTIPAWLLGLFQDSRILFSIHLRKWKYDESIMQHWVETSVHGSIVQTHAEKSVREEEGDADEPERPVVMNFDNGPGDGSAGPVPASDPGASSEVACQQKGLGFGRHPDTHMFSMIPVSSMLRGF